MIPDQKDRTLLWPLLIHHNRSGCIENSHLGTRTDSTILKVQFVGVQAVCIETVHSSYVLPLAKTVISVYTWY
jgi:hypothetical protein